MKRTTILIIFVISLSAAAHADGKMYWGVEKVPPEIPYQRAAILFDKGQETLILQSAYKLPPTTSEASLGWVVPVPTVPELATMETVLCERLFLLLDIRTSPYVIRTSAVLAGVLFVILFVGTGLLTLLSVVYTITSNPRLSKYDMPGAICAMIFCMLLVFVFMFFPVYGRARGISVFEVAPRQQVGMYDVRIVKSTDAAELIRWLCDNRFEYTTADRKAFEGYIEKGWCFVVARINPAGRDEKAKFIRESLLPPLILRFPVKTPIYPLALTGTAAKETEVLIYLMSTSKMTCDKRMKLCYAGTGMMGSMGPMLQEYVEPQGFFGGMDRDRSGCFCKFKSTLTPADMTTDLVFTPTSNDTPYRQHIIKW